MLTSRRRSLVFALPILAMLSLAGCGPAADKPAAAEATNAGIPSSQPVTAAVIRQEAAGFSVGQQMSMNEVFVFFDPMCPHCAMFWSQSAAQRNGMKFTWIPVGIMGKNSAGEGAAILAAKDKIEAMDTHAANVLIAMRTNTRPPSNATANVDQAHINSVTRNTQLLASFGADSVPYIVAVNGAGNIVLKGSGVMPTQVAAAFTTPAP